MEIFKLYESATANIRPGHMNIKDLRRDQLLDRYDDATKTLQTLIRAKESEIAYRKDLIAMLEHSRVVYDNKLMKAKQDYQTAKKFAPDNLDLKGGIKKFDTGSTTPPLPEPPTASSSTLNTTLDDAASSNTTTSPITPSASSQLSSSKGSDLDIPMPMENNENRSSLDRRLSEFLKTFPNLTQAGLAPPSSNDTTKPMPGYYTQQPPPPLSAAAPPIMAMMRFPPPSLLPLQPQQQPLPPPPPIINQHHHQQQHHQENHDATDMELSDYEETNAGGSGSSLPPMIASALQQGAGGKQGLRSDPQQASNSYGQQFNNPIPYTPRLNPLPFDPSIMDPGIRDSSSSSSRDRHSPSDRAGHRSGSTGSGRSGGSSSKHQGTSKNRYSSSSSTSSHSSSSKNKRR